jgi:hypothetical protein
MALERRKHKRFEEDTPFDLRSEWWFLPSLLKYEVSLPNPHLLRGGPAG